jgi:hypothetical protein
MSVILLLSSVSENLWGDEGGRDVLGPPGEELLTPRRCESVDEY